MTAVERLDEIEARAAAATEGPWEWRNTGEPYLMGAQSRVVMAFRRMGMGGAQPQFRDRDSILRDGGRENLNGFPDAAFIAAARQDVPTLLAALRAVLDVHRSTAVYDMADNCPCSHDDDDYDEHHFEAVDGDLLCDKSPTGEHWCSECHAEDEAVDWPCPTVRAITAALDVT